MVRDAAGHSINDRENILVVETRHLGDVLFATPAIRSLKIGKPKSRLTVLVRNALVPILEKNPHVDEIIGYWDDDYVSGMRDLRARSFGAAVLLDRDERMAQLAFQAKIPVRIGYDRPQSRKYLTVAVPRTEPGTSEIHWSLKLAMAAGGANTDERTELHSGSVNSGEKTLKKLGLESGSYVLLHPGSDTSVQFKRWPVGRFADVARQIADLGETVVVTGVARESNLADFFRSVKNCLPLIGQTSLHELIDLIRNSRLVVTNDTGPSHIAAALGRPCIVIAGFADPGIYHPYPSPHHVLYHPLACSPCFGSSFDPQDCPYVSCLKNVSVEDVVRRAASILENLKSPV